jgi:hypothetical protein
MCEIREQGLVGDAGKFGALLFPEYLAGFRVFVVCAESGFGQNVTFIAVFDHHVVHIGSERKAEIARQRPGSGRPCEEEHGVAGG